MTPSAGSSGGFKLLWGADHEDGLPSGLRWSNQYQRPGVSFNIFKNQFDGRFP
jgi:hypothetical protein